MTALLIVLAVLTVINLIPVGAKVRYDDGDLELRLKIGPLRLKLLPAKPVHGKKLAKQHEKKRLAEAEKRKKKALKKVKKRREKEKKRAEKQNRKNDPAPAAQPAPVKPEKPEKPKKKLTLSEIVDLLKAALGVVAKLPRKLKLNELCLHITYGGKDAAQAAIGYGRAWAAVGAIVPILEQIFRIRKRDVGVELDYERESMGIFARLDIHMLVGTAVLLALLAGGKFLCAMLKNGKGSAEK